MFPFKWKLSAKLLATVRKEPKYQGPFFSQYKHGHQPMFCASSFKANLAEGHSSTCQGAGPMEMFHLEPRLWGQRAVRRPYSLSSSRSIRCRARKNKGGIAPLLPRQTLTENPASFLVGFKSDNHWSWHSKHAQSSAHSLGSHVHFLLRESQKVTLHFQASVLLQTWSYLWST